MSKRIVAVLAAIAVVAPLALLARAEEKKEFKASCPVSGGPAKEANTRDFHGKKVYFCCQNCPKAYDADPAKFSAKVHQQLLQTGQMTQVGCPFSGGAVKPETIIEVAGNKVGFCCNNCKGKVEKASDEEKLAMVFGNIKKGFTLQTECPLSGKAIKSTVSTEHEGEKVFFCCEGCVEGFKKEPAKFVAKLPQFTK